MDSRSKSSMSSSSSSSSPASVKRASVKKGSGDSTTTKLSDKKENHSKLLKQSSSKSMTSPYSQKPPEVPKTVVQKSKSLPQTVFKLSEKNKSSSSSSPKNARQSSIKAKGGDEGYDLGKAEKQNKRSSSVKKSDSKGRGSAGSCNSGSGGSRSRTSSSSDQSLDVDKHERDKSPSKEKGHRLLETVRNHCLGKGDRGIHDLGVLFRHLDADYNKRIVYDEMRDRLVDYGLIMSDENIKCIFRTMDADKSGGIDFVELMSSLRPPMGERRVEVIYEAYDKLDRNGDGVVDHEEIKGMI